MIVALPGLFSYLFFICGVCFITVLLSVPKHNFDASAVLRDCGISWVSALVVLEAGCIKKPI